MRRLSKRVNPERSRRGQNTAEYAILIGLVIAAAVGMQIYVKRGLQARTKGAVEYVATQSNQIDSPNFRLQYEPYYLRSQYAVNQDVGGNTIINQDLTVVKTNAETSRAAGGYQQYTDVNQE